jgi:hypothetical protein
MSVFSPLPFIHSISNFNFFSLFVFPYYVLYSYVECTSAAIQALTAFSKLYPGHRREEIQRSIEKAAAFIEKIQDSDGSWFAPPFAKLLHFFNKILY